MFKGGGGRLSGVVALGCLGLRVSRVVGDH